MLPSYYLLHGNASIIRVTMKLLSLLLLIGVVNSVKSMWADPYLFTLAGEFYRWQIYEQNRQNAIASDGKPIRAPQPDPNELAHNND